MKPDALLELLFGGLTRSPMYTRALAQDGLQNKGNALAAVAAEELMNVATDIPARAVGGVIGGGIGSLVGPGGTVVGTMLGQHAGNLLKDAWWANHMTPMTFDVMNKWNPAGRLGLNNYPNEVDALITPTLKAIDAAHPMHHATGAADKYITQPLAKAKKEQVDAYLKSLKYKPDYRITPAQLRENKMQK